MHLAIRSTLVWFGLLILAFVNGAWRELILKNIFQMEDSSAHPLSCVSGIVLWTGFVLLLWKKLGIRSTKQAVWVGLGWFVSTFFFETFVLNRKLSWSEIFHTYDVMAGEYWGLVLLWIGVMPIVIQITHKTLRR